MSATSSKESELLTTQLESHADIVLSAIVRTMAAPNIPRSRAKIVVTVQGLRLATSRNHYELATTLMDTLDHIRLSSTALEDLVDLATQIDDCHLLPHAKTHIIDDILEQIVELGRNWDDVQESTAALEKLCIPEAESYLEELHDEMFNEAELILEPWTYGEPEDYDISELESAIDFIDNVYTGVDEPLGLEEGRAAVERQYSSDASWIKARDAQISLTAPHPDGPNEIDQLRCLLADYEDDVPNE